MQARYLSASPYNLVRIVLGPSYPTDTADNNVYARAQRYFSEWIQEGVLRADPQPCLYAYTQEFTPPDGGAKLVRKGVIGLGAVEDYSAGIVHRHEQTLAGPKKDRLELLRRTHAHFGQIFMLYADPDLALDRIVDAASAEPPAARVEDEFKTIHCLWPISSAATIREAQRILSGKKLLIADGHHRYETALAFRNENPELAGAANVMMTFVNMHSPGLKILATHRVVSNLADFNVADLVQKTGAQRLQSVAALKDVFATPAPTRLRIGIAVGRAPEVYLIDRERRQSDLDVQVLHREILAALLGIDEEAVRDESHLQYVRGIDAALEKLTGGAAQIVFLLEPTTIAQVAKTAFSGGVMPQKSTDFYPKLLSGLTIYKIDE